jgi:hypothetical protein
VRFSQTISVFGVKPQARTTSYASSTIDATRHRNNVESPARSGKGNAHNSATDGQR